MFVPVWSLHHSVGTLCSTLTWAPQKTLPQHGNWIFPQQEVKRPSLCYSLCFRTKATDKQVLKGVFSKGIGTRGRGSWSPQTARDTGQSYHMTATCSQWASFPRNTSSLILKRWHNRTAVSVREENEDLRISVASQWLHTLQIMGTNFDGVFPTSPWLLHAVPSAHLCHWTL